MSVKPYDKDWKDLIFCFKRLQRDFPCDHKVVLRTVPYKTLYLYKNRCYGAVWWSDKSNCFVIALERNTLDIMIDTLWHEYAHILTWNPPYNLHTRKYWVKYGEIFHHYCDGVKNAKTNKETNQ